MTIAYQMTLKFLYPNYEIEHFSQSSGTLRQPKRRRTESQMFCVSPIPDNAPSWAVKVKEVKIENAIYSTLTFSVCMHENIHSV